MLYAISVPFPHSGKGNEGNIPFCWELQHERVTRTDTRTTKKYKTPGNKYVSRRINKQAGRQPTPKADTVAYACTMHIFQLNALKNVHISTDTSRYSYTIICHASPPGPYDFLLNLSYIHLFPPSHAPILIKSPHKS